MDWWSSVAQVIARCLDGSKRICVEQGGGLAAAAAAAAGVTVAVDVDRVANAPQPWLALAPGKWLPVASVDSLAEGQAPRFTANSLVGFVRRTADSFLARSGACTHMGCLLDWNASARAYDCLCHGGRFTEAGVAAPSSPSAYRPLPKLQTRVERGKVWVYVPATASPPDGSAPTPTEPYVGHIGQRSTRSRGWR